MTINLNRLTELTIEDIQQRHNPFEDDMLDRAPMANNLVNIIKNTQEACVFNINSPYGTGKTFFLQRLKALLEKRGCPAVLFNSWETDWVENPLIAIIEELRLEISDLTKKEKSFLSEAFTKSWEEISSAMAGITEIAVKSIPVVSHIAEATDAALEHKNRKTNPLDLNYLEIKRAKNNLKHQLAILTEQLPGPLVIIIDELDRCRPDYAVRTLETIKHLFNIPKVVFVLAMDRSQIESAVSTLYGKKIEEHSSEYLRKFIDFDLYFPPLNSTMFADMLFDRYINNPIQKFLTIPPLKPITISGIFPQLYHFSYGPAMSKYMCQFFKMCLEYYNFSLRAQVDVARRLNLLLSSLDPTTSFFSPEMAIWLVSLNIFDPISFEDFVKTENMNRIYANEIPKDSPSSLLDSFWEKAKLQNIHPQVISKFEKNILTTSNHIIPWISERIKSHQFDNYIQHILFFQPPKDFPQGSAQ